MCFEAKVYKIPIPETFPNPKNTDCSCLWAKLLQKLRLNFTNTCLESTYFQLEALKIQIAVATLFEALKIQVTVAFGYV